MKQFNMMFKKNRSGKTNLFPLYFFIICLLFIYSKQGTCTSLKVENPQIIYVGQNKLQKVIDAAAPYSTIICDKSKQISIDKTIVIKKPLTISGLNAVLSPGLGKTAMILVESEGFQLYDFELFGNIQTVDRENKKPLVIINYGNFRIENGTIINSSKDGFSIIPADGGTIEGGIIRDVVGINNRVDVISIDGGSLGEKINQILVENIRGYNSEEKGVVEVSDGVENVTVRKIYAENSLYAVDVQQHSHVDKVNRNVVVEDIVAIDCKHAIRTANFPVGHTNLTIRDVIAKRCIESVKVKNTANVVLEKIRVIDQKGDGDLIYIENCDGLTVRDITVQECVSSGCALKLENCNEVTVDDVRLLGLNTLSYGVRYKISTNKSFSNLIISKVSAKHVSEAGIVLEKNTKGATLTDYIISNNIAIVADRINGSNGLVINNLSKN